MTLKLGGVCYSNTTTLTTGNFGEWKTEQSGINIACNNVSKDYYLNININGEDQTPRRRLVMFDFLRKNVDEISNGSVELNIVKVKVGLKDLNKAIWQSKLDYARELANNSLISQQKVALKLITTTTTTGESIESKIIKLQQAGEQAKTLIKYEFDIAQAKILEAKRLALLNGEKPEDLAAIDAEANLHLTILNLTAQKQIVIVEQALNDSIIEVINSDNGIRFCLNNGTNCQNNPIFSNITANNGFFSFLGSLTNRITKFFVQDIDVSNNIKTTTLDVSTNATLESLIFRRHDAFGMAILLNKTNEAIRIFASPNITNPSNGAGLQLFGNTAGFFPGDVYLDAGSISGGQIIMRTGTSGLNDRIIVEDDGKVKVLNLTGSGNDYLCVDANGYIFRSNTAC